MQMVYLLKRLEEKTNVLRGPNLLQKPLYLMDAAFSWRLFENLHVPYKHDEILQLIFRGESRLEANF